MEIRKGVVRSYDAANHQVDVQILGSMATMVKAVPVAHHLGPELLGAGTLCGALFFEGEAAVVFCVWGGSQPAWVTSGLIRDATVTEGDLGFEPVMATHFQDRGDLLVGKGRDLFDRLGVGSDGEVLTADSAQSLGVKWGSASAAVPQNGIILWLDSDT